MYYIRKTLEVSSSHHLNLSYASKCTNVHGHNWLITVFCKSQKLNADGMVIDFTHIKHLIQDHLDHKDLNEVFPFNPTAENIARWITDNVPCCYRTEIQESRGNMAAYEKDELPAESKVYAQSFVKMD